MSIRAHYEFEVIGDPEKIFESLAAEQTTTGVDPRFRRRTPSLRSARAEIISIQSKLSGKTFTGSAVIGFPLHHISQTGSLFEDILCFVSGETHHLTGIHHLKLQDIELPNEFLSSLPGPRYGVSGVRDIVQVVGRPLLMGPLRPEVGLNASEYAEIAYRAWLGGADIIKDDELLVDPEYCSLAERVAACVEMRNRAQQETGEQKLYFAHLGADVTQLAARLALMESLDADGVMLQPRLTPSIIEYARSYWDRIIVSHYAMLSSLGLGEKAGISMSAIQYLYRLAGADIITLPRPNSRFAIPDADYKQCIQVNLKEVPGKKPSLPAPTGGNDLNSISEVLDITGTCDYVYVSGSALFEAQETIEMGAAGLRKALEHLSLQD